jgi:hypothetical protein
MCAEKDPLECHRSILICRTLRDSAPIQHILADGSLESHAAAELRLMNEERVPTEDLFISPLELLMNAYDRRAQKVAFHEETSETERQAEQYA